MAGRAAVAGHEDGGIGVPAGQFEHALGDLESVDSLDWRRRREAMLEKAGLGPTLVEAVAVVGDQAIGLAVDQTMEVRNKGFVVMNILLERRIIRKAMIVDFPVALPFVRK